MFKNSVVRACLDPSALKKQTKQNKNNPPPPLEPASSPPPSPSACSLKARQIEFSCPYFSNKTFSSSFFFLCSLPYTCFSSWFVLRNKRTTRTLPHSHMLHKGDVSQFGQFISDTLPTNAMHWPICIRLYGPPLTSFQHCDQINSSGVKLSSADPAECWRTFSTLTSSCFSQASSNFMFVWVIMDKMYCFLQTSDDETRPGTKQLLSSLLQTETVCFFFLLPEYNRWILSTHFKNISYDRK